MSVIGDPIICDVCEKENAIGVCSLSLGAMSCAFCAECLQAGAEPWFALVATAMGPPELVNTETIFDHFDPMFKDICEATFERTGKTLENLVNDCHRADRELREMEEAAEEAKRLGLATIYCRHCGDTIATDDEHFIYNEESDDFGWTCTDPFSGGVK